MSDFKTHRLQKEDSQSSDEKMDTGSESFKSTPNSTLSDFEDKSIENVLRLQNPDVLRLAEPENCTSPLSDSLITEMSNLNMKNTPDNNSSNLNVDLVHDNKVLAQNCTQTSNLVEDNKTSAQNCTETSNLEDNKTSNSIVQTLDNTKLNFNVQNTETSNLMVEDNKTSNSINPTIQENTKSNYNVQNKETSKLVQTNKTSNSIVQKKISVDISENIDRPNKLNIQKNSNLVLTTSHPLMGLNSPEYPDVVPKLVEEKDLSLSSIEDEKYNLYSPETNNSKNNLYFSENFVTAESMESKVNSTTPDVARIEQRDRKKSSSRLSETPRRLEKCSSQPLVGLTAGRGAPGGHSTPVTRPNDFGKDVAPWCESPTHNMRAPNFDLPIELSTDIAVNNGAESPDVLSSPRGGNSLYEALVDARAGRVSLQPRRCSNNSNVPTPQRRKIMLPPEDDDHSLDSISVSMDSEEEPPELEPRANGPNELKSPNVNGPSDLGPNGGFSGPKQLNGPTRLHGLSEPADLNGPSEQSEIYFDASDDETKKSKSTSTVSSERTEPIPEYSAAEERDDQRSWLTVISQGTKHTCDMKVIEPFKRVLSHGGYDASGAALIVFRACYLPDSGRPDYRYVMDNLFLYLIWSLERLVTDEYVLIVLHGRCSLPPPRYLHRCYLLVDRRLRKSLKHLYLVHPTFWIRSVVFLFKPFVSSKFFKKLTYIYSLKELSETVPVDTNSIPDLVRQYEATRR